MLVFLIILTVTFLFITLFSIIQANMALFHIEALPLLSLKILDTSSAASLFVTLLGALLVRHQFVLSLLPRINYKSARAARENGQSPHETCETWRVDIRNTGLGSAIVNRTEFFVEFNDVKSSCHFHTFDGVINDLGKAGLLRERDYWIKNLTAGFSLSPKDDCFVFEIKVEHTGKIKRLDMVLYFQGQLGDRYRREIILIPRSKI